MTKKLRQKFKYPENEKIFKKKEKAFFIIFKGFSLKQYNNFLEGWKSDFNFTCCGCLHLHLVMTKNECFILSNVLFEAKSEYISQED